MCYNNIIIIKNIIIIILLILLYYSEDRNGNFLVGDQLYLLKVLVRTVYIATVWYIL